MPKIRLISENNDLIGEHEVTEEELQFLEDFAKERNITFDQAYNHMVRIGMEIEHDTG